jgi:hypothetical protein
MSEKVKVKTHTSSTIRSSPNFSIAGRVEGPKPTEAVPGPGKYGTPAVTQTLKRASSWTFGNTARESTRNYRGGLPGPGAYNAHEPYKFIQKTVFGSDSRMPDKKASGVPPPGTYVHNSTLTKKPITMVGRYPGNPASTTPAPGAYTPSFSQVHDKVPRPHMDTKEDRAKADTFKVKSWKTNAPDPGRYNTLKTMGPNLIMSRSSPNFSLGTRRRPPKSDSFAGPGPVLTDYSVFHR